MSAPTAEQLAALERFAARSGRTWKAKLRDVWLGDPVIEDQGHLRSLRNELGPRWLQRFKLTTGKGKA